MMKERYFTTIGLLCMISLRDGSYNHIVGAGPDVIFNLGDVVVSTELSILGGGSYLQLSIWCYREYFLHLQQFYLL